MKNKSTEAKPAGRTIATITFQPLPDVRAYLDRELLNVGATQTRLIRSFIWAAWPGCGFGGFAFVFAVLAGRGNGGSGIKSRGNGMQDGMQNPNQMVGRSIFPA